MNMGTPISASGVEVTIADLGEWGESELRSEYDPSAPIIRINSRVVHRIQKSERERFVAYAIGHEVYHHRERIGIIQRIGKRAERERMADTFAAEYLHEFEAVARALLLRMGVE